MQKSKLVEMMIARGSKRDSTDDEPIDDGPDYCDGHYLYRPDVGELDARPATRRSQGRSRADGYYWHTDPAAAGLYWVAQALRAMPTARRFPLMLRSSRMREARAALVLRLAENLTNAIRDHATKLKAAVRHRETYELIRKLETSKLPEEQRAAADLAKAEATLSASMIDYPGDERTEHLYWLNPNDEQYLRKLIDSSTLDVTKVHSASRLVRERIEAKFPKAVAHAASEATHYSLFHKHTKPLDLHDHKEICRIRSDHSVAYCETKLNLGGNLHFSAPAWAHEFLWRLFATWMNDPLAWEKCVFRLVEPRIRAEEFARAASSRDRSCAGKAYLWWQESYGRYTGMCNTRHNVLLRAVGALDQKSQSLLTELDLAPRKKGGMKAPTSWFERFAQYGDQGSTLLFVSV